MVNQTGFVGGNVVKKVFQNCVAIVSGNRSGSDRDKLSTSVIKKGVLTTLLLLPVLAQALGLGTLTTNSSLNEPFDAKIQLLNTNLEELETLTVSLAGVEQFKSAGIERPFLLSSLEFVVVEDGSGHYLHITSEESIKEPFLNFLLEVNWAKGRLIREYTALLDPPVFDTNTRVVDTTEPAVTAPVAKKPVKDPAIVAPVKTQAPKNIKIEQLPDATLVSDLDVESGAVVETGSVAAKAPSAPVSKPVGVSHDEPVVYQDSFKQQQRTPTLSSGDTSYTTSRGDTLWSIARQSRPDRSVSIQQMMLSLLNTNPNAFYEPNINSLKSGHILRIPDEGEVKRLTRTEAIALVKEHNELWDDYRQGLASSVTKRPVGSVSSTGTVIEDVVEEEVVAEPELRLISATDDASSEDATSGAGESSDEKAKVLEDDLALVSEELESGKNENVELKDRLKESEEIVGLLKQQVELKNQELAALQKKLREADLADEGSETVYLDNAKAAEEAQAKAAEESQAKAEEEAQAKAEEEAQAKAEEEAQAKAEEEAQAKAEEEAQAKAEEEAQAKAEEEAQAKAEEEEAQAKAEEESIDDILAQLDGEEGSETSYLEYDEQIIQEIETEYSEYSAPAENLAGKEAQTQYLNDADSSVEETQEQVIAEDQAEAVITEEQAPEEVDEPQLEEGILDKIKGFLPTGIVDSIPGGIKTVMGILLGLFVLLLAGIFKLFGRGSEDEAETLDLLDPLDFDEDEEVVSEDLEQETLEQTLENSSDAIEIEVEDEIDEEFSLDFEEEVNEEEVADELPDLLEDEGETEEVEEDSDEFTTEGLVNLEDTLEQIKPLLEQTEEDDAEDDPLEEVNLSLAYEQFDKAESIVKKAIEEHPEEDGYKLRLLEVHYAANNQDAYEDAARSLNDVTDGEGHLWESAVAMWSEMSPDRDLFEDVGEGEDSAIDSQDPDTDEDGSISLVAGMSAAGVVGVSALLDSESDDDSEFINIADETSTLEDTEMIDISAENTDEVTADDDFLNIAETGETEEDFLNIAETDDTDSSTLDDTVPGSEDELSLDIESNSDSTVEDGLDFEMPETDVDEDPLNIDMLDITAAGSAEGVSIAEEADAEELFELTNEFKSVDESVLSTTSTESEESAEILEFTSDTDELASTDEQLGLAEEETASTDDEELESLAKSLEDTISGLDAGGLDDLTFEFDPDGTLESTLTSTLGISSDLDLDSENESDEIDTKLNLAKAYIELGDSEGAKDILHEVSVDGNEDQKKDADELLQQIT